MAYGLGPGCELVVQDGKKEFNADKTGMHAKHADGSVCGLAVVNHAEPSACFACIGFLSALNSSFSA
jgi:hypothetical protein